MVLRRPAWVKKVLRIDSKTAKMGQEGPKDRLETVSRQAT